MEKVKTIGRLMLAVVVKSMGTEEDKPVVDGVSSEIGPGLKKAYDLSINLPKNKVTKE